MVVDTHAHIIVPEITAVSHKTAWSPKVYWEDGRQFVEFGGKKISSALREFVAIEAILAAQEVAEVDHLVLTVWSSLFGYELPIEEAADVNRIQNEAMATLAQTYPDKLTCLGTVPLQDVETAVSELTYCIETLNLPGVEIGTNVNGIYLGAEEIRPFWAKAEELGAIVQIHPVPGVGGRTKGQFYLWNLWANPAETALNTAHMILSGLLDDHPTLKINLFHGGGHLPYQIGRLDRGFERRPELSHLAKKPSEYLKQFYFDTITHSLDALAYLVDLVGAEQVMVGSDYPFDMGYDKPAELVEALDLSASAKAKILSGNATALFGLRT